MTDRAKLVDQLTGLVNSGCTPDYTDATGECVKTFKRYKLKATIPDDGGATANVAETAFAIAGNAQFSNGYKVIDVTLVPTASAALVDAGNYATILVSKRFANAGTRANIFTAVTTAANTSTANIGAFTALTAVACNVANSTFTAANTTVPADSMLTFNVLKTGASGIDLSTILLEVTVEAL